MIITRLDEKALSHFIFPENSVLTRKINIVVIVVLWTSCHQNQLGSKRPTASLLTVAVTNARLIRRFFPSEM